MFSFKVYNKVKVAGLQNIFDSTIKYTDTWSTIC